MQTQDTLAKTTDELTQTCTSLAESRFLVREHEKSEFHMVSTAEHLRKSLAQTQGENEKLFTKIGAWTLSTHAQGEGCKLRTEKISYFVGKASK